MSSVKLATGGGGTGRELIRSGILFLASTLMMLLTKSREESPMGSEKGRHHGTKGALDLEFPSVWTLEFLHLR